MLPEEKLRRTPALVGALVVVAALSRLIAALVLPGTPVAVSYASGVLVLLGLALWLHGRGQWARTGVAAAGLAFIAVLAVIALDIRDGNLSLGGWLPPTSLATPAPTGLRLPIETALLLGAAAVAQALVSLGGRRRPYGLWFAVVVVAVAGATLAMHGMALVTKYARPLDIGAFDAALLLVVSLACVLSWPEGRFVRMLLATSAVGTLTRRMFYGMTLLPAGLIGLTLLLITLRWIEPISAPIFLLSGLIIAGLIHAMASAGAASTLDERRKAAESEHARLNAVLEQQAARLQELVARRTSELRTLSVNLRTTTRENAQLGLVARNTTNGVVITDGEGNLEWANTAFERMTGYTLAEVKGRKPGQFLQGPDTDPAVVAQIRRALETGERCYAEVLNYTKSRHPYWQIVDMEPVRDASGKLINWIAIQTDVTAHRLAEQHLRTLNERLQLATQSAALGVWEWDANTQKHTWDDRTHTIHGLKPGEFDGSFEGWMKCLHPDDRRLAEARFQLVLAGGNFYDQEFRLVPSSDGVIRHVESRAVVQRDAQGRLLRITGTSRDITVERENEERLRALNDRLQLALRASRYGVWDLNPATGRFIWDDRLFQIYGVTRETFPCTSEAWLNLLHPDDRSRMEHTIHAPRPGHDEIDNEFRIIVQGGFLRHIETHGYVRRDEHGRPVRIVGMDRDITAEKQTLEALRMAEERWQLAVEGTNDGVWDWNVATGVTYHDQRWFQMLGYEPGEVADTIEAWNSLVHPDDLPANLSATEDHFARRSPLYHHEYRIRTKSGEWKWIMDRGKVVSRDGHGQPLRMVGMHTDVTARKSLEQRLHQFEQLATQVSELTQIGGWELDLDTMQLTWSEQVRRLHEVDEDYRPTVHTSIEFYAPEVRDTLSSALKAAMTQGRSYDLELPLVTAKGRRIWVRALTRAEFRDNKPVRLIGALQDISSRRDSEEARRKLEFQLFQAQKMETLGTLAGGIAHDFNNLLTGIMGYQELVSDVLGENSEARDYLAQARGASVRARELVEQILTFGRQSSDDQHTPLDLALVVEEARRLLRATIPATIAIETHIEPECGFVQGDATQLHQVLLNLGSNAAHAMQLKGGVLAIGLRRADRTTSRSATLATLPPGEYVELSVTDNGHGMDEGTLQRIFDPFFTTKEVREGTGLGLAVVHGIVRAHRGAIDVESRTGIGSTFHIYLPVAATEAENGSEQAAQAPRGAGEVIYIVDDEDTVASFTKFALENKGYRASTVDTAVQCLEMLRANPGACSVLVTDQTMPGMTGTELAMKVREFAPELPIIVMSGYFLKITPQELAEIGKVELLGKPFTTDELAWTVHRALHPEPAVV
ncbi:PAS domain-containing hybrid sensor histidine kinase/response regulator [Opitutus terrae]|uniref:histidine kinase n=1 Tax=Opitutus terrae (strain DSM 11246 / JCM 15787 / PB90-1) TaxID=452637 RepID=B1ZR09_OPITP|nr:PAS domain-containing protein [Opitutus terrae]ACB73676.1 multi-sensor hybrid histidine kinase [Opitutus terrae PB90-1]